MNIYSTKFFATCPVNKVRVEYDLTITTDGAIIQVEELLEVVNGMRKGFHEAIADQLFAHFGGCQTLKAFHHGVWITTERA